MKGVLAVLILLLSGAGFSVAVQAQEVTVYKDPNCGCCSKWVDHLRENGFEVAVHDSTDLAAFKAEQGVKPAYASCHTAVVDGYTIEGHVPASDIRTLLSKRPAVRGLSVPGMPMGSPGMEGPYSESYEVLSFDAEGNTTVYSRH